MFSNTLRSFQKSRLARAFLALLSTALLQGMAFGQTDTWKGGNGNWSTGGMWTAGVPGSTSNVAIDGGNATASTVTLDISDTINSLTIDSDDKLSFNLNTQLTVNGGSISNAGQITINGGSATNSELTLGASTALSGGGTVTLSSVTSGGGVAFIQGNSTTLTNANNTIQGDGIIGNGSLTLINQAGGTIDANSSGGSFNVGLILNGSGGVTNAGLLEATNSGVLAIQNTVNNSGGNITAKGSGATVQLLGADIQGGSLNTASGGTLITPNGNSSTLDGSTKGALTLSSGSTYTGDFNSNTQILGTINNNGNFQINGGSATNSELSLVGNTILQGSGGKVTLSSTTSGGGVAYIQGNSQTLTNTNNLIQGAGIIGNGSLTLINQSGGTIDASGAGAGFDTGLTLDGSGGVTNAGLLEATNNGVLAIQNTVNNAGGNITANGSNASVQLLGASIRGGTLNTKNSGTFITPNGNSSTLDGSTNGALTLGTGSTYTGDFNSNTQVVGTINNNGNFQINGGSATNSELSLLGNTTLQGSGGKVTLSSTTSGGGVAYIQGNGATLTNTNNTIQGDGIIGNGSLALINQAGGTIDANSAGGTFDVGLALNGSGGVTNTGLLEATNNGVLSIQNTVNNSGGNITASGATATVQLIGADIQGGTLNTVSGGTFITPNGNSSTLDGTTKGALTLSTGSTYTGDLNSNTQIVGTINNNGNFQINGGSATNSELSLLGNTTLQGSGGKVTLSSITSGGGVAYIQGNSQTLTNTNNLIQGAGIIGNGSLTLINQSGGTINASGAGTGFDNGLTLNGTGGVTNAGLLEATNNGVLSIQNTVNNSGGKITANGSNAFVQLLGADIQGGTLNTVSGGTFITPNGNSATLDGKTHGALTLSKGSTYTGDFNTNTQIVGTINNNGNFQINGGSATNSELTLAGNTTLQGSGGTVTMNTVTSGGGAAFIQGNGFTLTNSTDTIQGAGIIGNGSLSLINNAGGTIFANTSGQTLLINGSGKITNNGTFKVASGAALHVQNGPFTNFAGTTLTGGTYNTAGTLQIDELGTAGGEIVTNAANIILSGPSSAFIDANGNNALSAFNNNASKGSFTINNGRNFTTAGNFTNNGVLTVGSSNSKFDVNGNLTNFSGTTLTGGTYNVTGTLQFNGANIVTNAANITLSGASSSIVNQSAVNALANFATNASGASFTINSGRNFTTAGAFTNNGILTVGSGSKFDVNGNLTNFAGTTLTGGTYNVTGTLQFNGANIVTNAANITLSGASSAIINQSAANGLAAFAVNNGTFGINSGRNFTTAGNFTNNGTLTVGSSNSKFDVNGNLTNFSGTTLTGGTYNITGTLQFNGANIVTNAANITLSGASSAIINQSAANGLANFATNAGSGSFSLASGRNFNTLGNFSNAGTLNIAGGTSFTVGGTGLFTQSGGKTTDDGTLTDSGGLNLTGGSLFGKGTISGNVNDSAGIVNPGDSLTATGILTDKGKYTQGSSGALDISIGGLTGGTQFDELNATSASLNGTLKVNLINGFVPKIGQTFKIMNFSSETGTFSTCSCAINSTEHFSVTYQGTDVLLTVVSGAAASTSPTAILRPHYLQAGLRLNRLFGDGNLLWNWRRSELSGVIRPGLIPNKQNFTRSFSNASNYIRDLRSGSEFSHLLGISAFTRHTGLVLNNTHITLAGNEFRQRVVMPANELRLNGGLRSQPIMRNTFVFSSLARSGHSSVPNDLLRTSMDSHLSYVSPSTLPHTASLSYTQITPSSVSFQRFSSAARIQEALTRQEFHAVPARTSFAATLSSPSLVVSFASAGRSRMSFGNSPLNTLRARSGSSRLGNRMVTGGFSWGLSNLRSKPRLGFEVH